jgi:sulfonate transport system substrate-binding protein
MRLKHTALVLFACLVLPAWAGAGTLQPLHVANQKSSIKLLLDAAGELKDLPYSIEWSEFPAAAPLGEALNAGAVDVGGLGDAPYVFALGAGAPLKVVSVIHIGGRFTTAILVPRDSPLHSVADLRGRRIVTGRGSIGHFLALRALREAGLASSEVNFIYLLPSDARGLLDSGGADAWSTWEPYTTIATTQNAARVLLSGEKLLSNNLYLAATSQAVAGKRVQLEDFVKRIERAYRWSNEHPEAYAKAQARVTGLPLDVHLEMARNTRFQRIAIDDPLIAELQTTADLYRQEGIVDRPIDVSRSFDKSFNAAAAEPLKPLAQARRPGATE